MADVNAYLMFEDGTPVPSYTDKTDYTNLTAPGSTTGLSVLRYKDHVFQYTITNIDTNVVIRVEGSLDDTSWYTMLSDDVTKLANGTYDVVVNDRRTKYIRFTFVSETGGTAAVIAIKYFGSN